MIYHRGRISEKRGNLSCLVFVGCLFSNWVTSCSGQDPILDNVVIPDSSESVVVQDINMPESIHGKTQIAVIKISNRSSRQLEIRGVDTSCGCVRVDISKATQIAPNDAAEVFVSIAPESNRKSLKQTYQILMRCSGSCEHIALTLKTETLGYVGFVSNTFAVGSPPSTDRWQVSLPLVVSTDVHLRDFEVEVGEDAAKFIDTKFEKKDGLDFVSLSYDARRCSELGSVPITIRGKRNGVSPRTESDAKVRQTCQLWFSIKKPIEVLPRSILFLPTAEGGYRKEARAIVRVSNASKELQSISSVECRSENGAQLTCELTEVRSGYYSMKIKLKDSKDLKDGESLRFSFTTTNDRSVVDAQAHFSN